jgi:aminoglycoside phosphotransferase (APT) family kinase protein
MDGLGLESGPICNAAQISGGTQNILVRFRRGAREFVLRRPPVHPRPKSDETIQREARILDALKNTNVPHPRFIAACVDRGVLGCAFYLMEPVDGFNPRGQLPSPHADDATLRREMGLSLIEGIAKLSRVEFASVGLADFGKIDGFLERQVSRWRAQLESYREHDGWPGPAQLGEIAAVERWLETGRPRSLVAGLVHGDYHLSNVLFKPRSAELAAIVDWELSTLGDPLIDLGWILATWPDPDGMQRPGIVGTAPWDGFPTANELVTHYQSLTGRDLSSIAWFAVLASYKLAIVLEGTFARACAGKADSVTGARLHSAAMALIDRSFKWMN